MKFPNKWCNDVVYQRKVLHTMSPNAKIGICNIQNMVLNTAIPRAKCWTVKPNWCQSSATANISWILVDFYTKQTRLSLWISKCEHLRGLNQCLLSEDFRYVFSMLFCCYISVFNLWNAKFNENLSIDLSVEVCLFNTNITENFLEADGLLFIWRSNENDDRTQIIDVQLSNCTFGVIVIRTWQAAPSC